MDKETKDIVTLIAGIQIESLLSLKTEVIKEGKFNEFGFPLLKTFLELQDDLHIEKDELIESINQHLNLYMDIEQNPSLIKIVSEYQLMLCSHILFRMEDEWVQTNSQGVMGCWELIRNISLRFHPELTLLKL